MNDIVLETKGLTKTYGATRALDRFSVRLEKDRIIGLLGRNGAGKTTFLNLVSSRIFPDAGEIALFGGLPADSPEALAQVCYMPEKNLFIPRMKVRDILRAAEDFYPGYDAAFAGALCEKFRLSDKKRYRELSRGYESILRIVVGLAARAPLTIFDEPVLGLDAAVRELFYRELIADFTGHPRTILVSTHLIEESADVFNDVLMIREGKLESLTSAEELRESAFYLSGRADAVARAAAGMRVVHTETVGSVKVCAVYGKAADADRERWAECGVDAAPVPVQKLFIYLTDEKGGNRE